MAIAQNGGTTDNIPRSLSHWRMTTHFRQRLNDRDLCGSEVEWAIENGNAEKTARDTIRYECERIGGETVVVKCNPLNRNICTVFIES